MNKDNFAKTTVTILSALLFIVVGSCFTAFMYKTEVVKVNDPRIVTISGISVFNEKGDKTITKLELSNMKLGLKPATGEENADTGIPSTVHDHQGSEGHFAVFKLYAPSGCSIYVTNIKIESDKKEEVIKKERENIMVSIKELKESTTSLKEDKVLVGKTEASEERNTYTFFVWLSAKTSDEFDSTTISFDLSFEALA